MLFIKKITFHISLPYSGLTQGKTFIVQVKDDAKFYEALAMVDKYIINHPEESIFPIYDRYIRYYLQLFWDPIENKIYEDCGLMAYGPDREFMPLRDNIEFELYPDCYIDLQPDPGC